MFKSILLAMDLNDPVGSTKPAQTAAKLAVDYAADLHVVNVVPDFGMSIVGAYFQGLQNAFPQVTLQQVQRQLSDWTSVTFPTGQTVQVHVRQGTIYDEILKAADEIGCDAIVIGAHRPELKDYLVGPNAARVMRHARQSVFIVR